MLSSRIWGDSWTQISGHVDANVFGNVDTTVSGSVDVGGFSELTNSLENMVLLGLCLLGFLVGWRKVIPAIALFVFVDIAKNGRIEDSERFIPLFATTLLVAGFRWCKGKLQNKRSKRKTAESELSAHEVDQLPESSISRALARTGK